MYFPAYLLKLDPLAPETIAHEVSREEARECVFENRHVAGRIDLKHLTIPRPVTFRNCSFDGELDLRYCKAEQTLRFENCCFHAAFNAGDRKESCSCFSKDLHFIDCAFYGDALFNGVVVDGGLYIDGTRFWGARHLVDFAAGTFRQALYCQDVFFASPPNFNAMQCLHVGAFNKTEFATGRTRRDGGPEPFVNFVGATFGTLQCVETTFFCGAKFSGVKCKLAGFFKGAQFLDDKAQVSFVSSSFASLLNCQQCTFNGGVEFTGLQVEVLDLNGAKFFCTRNPCILSFARISRYLDARNTAFHGPTRLNGIVCEGDGWFDHAVFAWPGEAHFRFVEFKGNLFFRDAKFQGSLDLDGSVVRRTLSFERATLDGVVTLTSASVQRLSVAEVRVLNRRALRLRGFTFETFDGTRSQAFSMVGAQQTRFFSRDPYIQLEKYFLRIGDETNARQAHYVGQCKLRENAFTDGGPTEWTWRTKFTNLLVKSFTGYGVKNERLLAWALPWLVLGTVLFWNDGSLKPKQALPDAPEPFVQQIAPVAVSLSEKTNFGTRFYERTAYSIDLFLPVVDLEVARKWNPATLGLRAYAALHMLAGWLLIPLLVTSFASAVRIKQNKSGGE